MEEPDPSLALLDDLVGEELVERVERRPLVERGDPQQELDRRLPPDHGDRLDHALGGLLEGLSRTSAARSTMVLVYSEFGRRVAENGSRGTDHGSAGPVFLAGGRAPGGIVGGPPDLSDTDDGDVRAQVDFRAVLGEALFHLDPALPADVLGSAGAPVFGT